MSSRFFGQYLLEKGRITSQQLLDAVECQKTIATPIGTMALERGWMSAEQIKLVLQHQKKNPLQFGELAVACGFLKHAQVAEILEAQQVTHRERLGEALVEKGYLSLETLERELKEYNKESEKLAFDASSTFDSVAHREIVKTFTELLLMMFTRFGKQDIIVECCESGRQNIRLFRWVIAQRIAGEEMRFKCLLSVPPKLLLQMASIMLDEPIGSPDELALDASKEFVNIANGNACAKLSEIGVNLSLLPPEVYETTIMPYPMHARDVVCVHLAAPDAKLEVAFEF